MTTATVLAITAAAGAFIGTTAGTVLASWAWTAASGETRRDPSRHRTGRNQP